MKTFILKTKKQIIKRIFGIFCFTSALFIFQACYGTPQDFGMDVHISGTVLAAGSNNPVQGIKVSLDEGYNYCYTDENGQYSMYAEILNQYHLIAEDIDSVENGEYVTADTLVNYQSEDELNVNMMLNPKE